MKKQRDTLNSFQNKRSTKKSTLNQKRVFLIRRIIAFAICLLVICLVVFAISFVVGSVEKIVEKNKAQSNETAKETDEGGPYGECSPTNLSIALSSTYNPIDNTVVFSEVFNHIGDLPCTIDLNSHGSALQIYSGAALLFSSNHCDDASNEILLGKGDSFTQQKVWAKDMSNPGACGGDKVKAGSYTAKFVTTTKTPVESNSLQIILP
jgi:hypothetical protein